MLDLHLGYFSLPIAACLTLLLYLYFVWFLARQILFMLPHAFAMALISILAVSVLSTYRLTVLSNPINNSHFLVGFFSAFSIWWAVRAIDGPVDSKRLNWMIAGLLGLAAAANTASGFLVFIVIAVLIVLKRFGVPSAISLSASQIVCLLLLLSSVSLSATYLVSADSFLDWLAIIKLALGILGLPISGPVHFQFFEVLVGGLTVILGVWLIVKCLEDGSPDIRVLFGAGLLCWRLLSILVISFFRHHLYSDLIGHGHRYGVYNLFVHLSLVFAGGQIAEAQCRKVVRILFLQRVALVLALAGLVANFVIGNLLWERKTQFSRIAVQLQSEEAVDEELFRRIAFFPSQSDAQDIYLLHVIRQPGS